MSRRPSTVTLEAVGEHLLRGQTQLAAGSSRPTLAASATEFDRLDEMFARAARSDRGDDWCEDAAELIGSRAAYCSWRNQSKRRKQTAPSRQSTAHSCGCGSNGHGGTELARRAEDELVKQLVTALLSSVIAARRRPALSYFPPDDPMKLMPLGWAGGR